MKFTLWPTLFCALGPQEALAQITPALEEEERKAQSLVLSVIVRNLSSKTVEHL